MFDLDIIEADWLKNSFKLSEEEIIEIYCSENVTLRKYSEEIDLYIKKINDCSPKMTPEERLFRAIFETKEYNEEIEQRKKLIESIPIPKKKRLSKPSQKKVIEGSLDIVFDQTRKWHIFFEETIQLEPIYYVCLEALMNSVKYMLHCEKPVFKLYVIKSIERNITKYIAKLNHITYRQAYQIIFEHTKEELKQQLNDSKLTLDNEIPSSPEQIFYQLRNDSYDVDYIKDISSKEFLNDYKEILNTLSDTERTIIQMTYDINGNRGMTNLEIAEYLGINSKKVTYIRRSTYKKIRKNRIFKDYKY